MVNSYNEWLRDMSRKESNHTLVNNMELLQGLLSELESRSLVATTSELSQISEVIGKAISILTGIHQLAIGKVKI